MKHSFRQRVLEPDTGLIATKIGSINAELGSGIRDKNGKEFFENDIVKFEDGRTSRVTFESGCFYIDDDLLGDFYILPKIVGYVED